MIIRVIIEVIEIYSNIIKINLGIILMNIHKLCLEHSSSISFNNNPAFIFYI
jgi:hypothetical protein